MRAEPEFYLAFNGIEKDFLVGEKAIPFVQYGSSDELNEDDDGFPTLRLNEISDGFIEDAEKCCNLLTQEDFQKLEIKKGDVLVCRTNGNPRLVGRAAVAMEDKPVAFASYLFRVRPNKEIISPCTLMVYLNCRAGRLEIEKHSIRSNQVNFSPERLRQMRLPAFGKAFQNEIDSAILHSYKGRCSAEITAIAAEEMLLAALALASWQPPEPLSYVRKFSEAKQDNRLDAEHFQPRYKAMLEHVTKNAEKVMRVGDFASYCERGTQPEYFEDGELAVVTSKHILEHGLDYDNFDRTKADYWGRREYLSARIFRNDILTYTTGAKVGRTAAYISDDRALASNHVNLLRVENENALYVAAVMNSMVGRGQTNMSVSGSAQVELYPSDIRNFVIPFVPAAAQKKIASQIVEAHHARQKAKVLLECAKRAVEIAIEKSEEKALAYLKENNDA